jgi:hypothetical protein
MSGPTKAQGFQLVNEAALAVLRQAARTQQETINAAIDQNFNQPLRLYASNPSDSKLNIGAYQFQQADGIGRSIPPNNSQIPSVVASTIDFQAQSTTGATFDLTWPASTVGQFRRMGLTLLSSGTITALFSAEAASVGALANAGTVFVKSGIPLGYIDLECTDVAGKFKTAGSATSIIENSVSGTSRIFIFGSGGSGSGAGDANTFLTSLQERLNDSFFLRLVYNIFSLDASDKVDPSSTAAYDVANSQYDFSGGGATTLASQTTGLVMQFNLNITQSNTYAGYVFTPSVNAALSSASSSLGFLSGTGNIHAELYATSGGFPIGSPLDTSAAIDITTLPAEGSPPYNIALTNFIFSGAIALNSGTTYAIIFKLDNNTAGVKFNHDESTSQGPLKLAYWNGSSWITGSPDSSYGVVNGTVATNLLSLDLSTPGFLANDQDIDQVEMIEDWGTADGAAVRQVSVDGGLNWTNILMSQIDVTNRYRGIATIPDPTTVSTLFTYDVSNADADESFNATTFKSQGVQLAAISSGVKKKQTKITAYINKLGSPLGRLTARIVKDSSGQPSTSASDIVATSGAQIISDLVAGDNAVVFAFNAILPAGTYWLVLDTDSTYQSSYSAGVTEIRWQVDSSAPTYTGPFSSFDGSAWSAIATNKPVFKIEGIGYELLSKISSTAGSASLNGYGLLFENGELIGAVSPQTVWDTSFSGDSDTTSFTLPFLPDPKRLVVFELTGSDTRVGRAYMYPGFALDGHNVTFPSGTFVDPGQTKQLRFLMIGGSGFDNSDANRALMAANHLGSTDGAVDQSSPGRGIILRRPDGTLREITIDNSDNIVILSVP